MLPKEYEWLEHENAPKMLVEALKLYGTQEKQGNANNPVIVAWANECGIRGYGADSIPWCGLFLAVVAKRAGKVIVESPLWARSWATWGTASPRAALGDVLVFKRDGGGHVGLYIGEDDICYHVLGGNQGDAVSIRRLAKNIGGFIQLRRLLMFGQSGFPQTAKYPQMKLKGEAWL